MLKKIFIVLVVFTIAGCEVTRELLGYIPPPAETTVGEELLLEYQRCLKIGKEKNCAQAAYDVVRVVKGLEARKLPKGVVTILRGDGGHGPSEQELKEKAEQIDKALQQNPEP